MRKYTLTLLAIFQPFIAYSTCPVNLVGYVSPLGSIATHMTGFINTLHDTVPLKVFKTKPCTAQGFAPYYHNLLNKGIDLSQHRQLTSLSPLSGITIFTDFILGDAWKLYSNLPNQSTLRFAYSVYESTMLPAEWVHRLNTYFDAVIVPDAWLIKTFQDSGVTIPIFTLPIALELESLLAKKTPDRKKDAFVFGFSGTFMPRKNQVTLAQAFVEEFGTNPQVKLIIHGRFNYWFEEFYEKLSKIKTSNVIVQQQCLSRSQYEDFLASLHCYVTASKAEGFSIIPYEALAAGVPCILSNNTAQTTICNTGFVRAIPANIIEPMEPSFFLQGHEICGHDFACTVADIRQALRDVYDNYDQYVARARQGREWARGYTAQGLKKKYRMLIKPTKVILGAHNGIEPDHLMTNSPVLFEKYKKLYGGGPTVFATTAAE